MADRTNDSVWDVRLLGSVRAVGVGRTVEKFRTRATAVLMARLALADGRALAREQLAGELWPEADVRSALRSLSTELHALRCDLEPAGIERRSIIQASNHDVRFVSERVTVDAVRFESLIKSGSFAGDDRETLEYLRRAIEIYDGDFLPGHYDDWTMSTRNRLEGLYFQALGRAIDLSANGSIDDSVTFARRAVAIDPWSQDLRRQLIRLLLDAGDRLAARHEAGSLAEWLKSEDVTPEDSTLALLDVVLYEPGRVDSDPAPPISSEETRPAPAVLPPATLSVAILYMDDTDDARSAQLAGAFERSIPQHGGRIEQAGTAALVATFARATDAVGAAIAAIRNVGGWRADEESGRDGNPDGVFAGLGRIAIHTAEATQRGRSREQIALAIATAAPTGSLLCSAATAVLAGSGLDPSVRLVDVGEYELGRHRGRMRLYAIVPMHDRDPSDLLIKAPRVGVTSLPQPTSPMFGRTRELGAAVKAFRDDGARLVTLTGPGGIGKSRLGLEVVRELFDLTSGRIWMVDTDELDDVQSVIDAALRTVSVEPPKSHSPRSALFEWLRRQSGGVIVFDGFERVVDQGGAKLVADLLEEAPELRCLVTSRRRLNIAAESWHVLGPLPTPDREDPADPEALMDFASVALFVERARTVAPDFRLDDTNAAAVAAICRRLDGYPLAIVLAAARVGIVEPADLLQRLSVSFALLRSRRPDLPARQRTLEDTMAWSIDLLPEDTRAVLAGLTVFHGDFDLDAAEAIFDDPVVIDHLAALEESSLLSVIRSSDGIRFHIPEVIRSQIVALLDVDASAQRQRHARYFADWTALICGTSSTAPGADVMRRLDVERENVRSALEYLIGVDDHETALQLASGAWRQWASRGWYRFGYDTLTHLLEAVTPQDRHLRARAEHGAGTLAYRLGDYRSSSGHYSRARDGFEAVGDMAGVAYATNNLAMFAQIAGDFDTASREYTAALEIKTRLGDRSGMARGHINLANVAFEMGDYDTALRSTEACIALQHTRDDRAGLAASYGLLGAIAEDRGDVEAAREAYLSGVEFARAARSRHAEGQNLRKLASWTRDYGGSSESEALYRRALAISTETGNVPGMAFARSGLATVLADLRRLDEAGEIAEQALSALDTIGNEAGIVRALIVVGHVGVEAGDVDAARTALQRCLTILESGRDARRLVEAIEACSGLAHLVGRHEDAAALERACLAKREHIGFPRSPKVSEVLARWSGEDEAEAPPTPLHQDDALSFVEAVKLAISI